MEKKIEKSEKKDTQTHSKRSIIYCTYNKKDGLSLEVNTAILALGILNFSA